jgi:hypothetical protein
VRRAYSSVAVVGADDVANVGEPEDQLVEDTDDRRTVLGADVEPDPGTPARHPGHVTEAAGGETQERSVFLGPLAGEAHQRRRRQVRDVADHGDQLVVALRRQCNDLGAERPGDHEATRRRRRRRCRAGREHPHGALEQVGLCAVETVEFRTGHRVSADEPRVVGRCADRRLDAADVGDGAACLGQGPLDLVDRAEHGDGDER